MVGGRCVGHSDIKLLPIPHHDAPLVPVCGPPHFFGQSGFPSTIRKLRFPSSPGPPPRQPFCGQCGFPFPQGHEANAIHESRMLGQSKVMISLVRQWSATSCWDRSGLELRPLGLTQPFLVGSTMLGLTCSLLILASSRCCTLSSPQSGSSCTRFLEGSRLIGPMIWFNT